MYYIIYKTHTRLCVVQWTLACPSNNKHVKYKRMKCLVKMYADAVVVAHVIHKSTESVSIKPSVFFNKKIRLLIQHSFVALKAVGEIFRVFVASRPIVRLTSLWTTKWTPSWTFRSCIHYFYKYIFFVCVCLCVVFCIFA